MLREVTRAACDAEIRRDVRSATRKRDYVVERHFSRNQALVADVTRALVAPDDGLTINGLNLGCGTQRSSSTMCFVGQFWKVAARVGSLIGRLARLDFIRVGFLPPLRRRDVLRHVSPGTLASACAFAGLAKVRHESSVHEEVVERVPVATLRALSEFLMRRNRPDVALGFQLGVGARCVPVPYFCATLTVRPQTASTVFVWRAGEAIKWQPFDALAAPFQPQVVIDRWPSAHGADCTVGRRSAKCP